MGSRSGVSDCAFPISLNVFGIVAVVLDSLKPRHHGKVPYPRRDEDEDHVQPNPFNSHWASAEGMAHHFLS